MKHKRTKKKNDFGSFIDFIDRSDIPYFIRDNESKFLYINKSGLFFLNIPSNFKIEGKTSTFSKSSPQSVNLT